MRCSHSPQSRLTLRDGRTICTECEVAKHGRPLPPPLKALEHDEFLSSCLPFPAYKLIGTIRAGLAELPAGFFHYRTSSVSLVNAAIKLGGELVDTHFAVSLPRCAACVLPPARLATPDDRAACVGIALHAGWSGRVAADPRIPAGSAQRYFARWVGNLFDGRATRIWVTGEDGVTGFLAARGGTLELLATMPNLPGHVPALHLIQTAQLERRYKATVARTALPVYFEAGARIVNVVYDIHFYKGKP